jgi:hypothetical protein
MTIPSSVPLPFEYLQALQNLAGKSAGSDNKAVHFYKLGGRNILFKLEALFRIYKAINDKDLFEKLNDDVKAAEDSLGQYDFEVWFAQQFKSYDGIFTEQVNTDLLRYENTFDTSFKNLGFIPADSDLYASFDIKLKSVQWPSKREFAEQLTAFLIKKIEKIIHEYDEGNFDLSEPEEGLHELRRKIRWISIYASVANGYIQLKPSPLPHPDLQRYQTEDIIHSPFNELPKKPRGIVSIQIQSPNFYALSWMIQELGVIKDRALLNSTFEERIKNYKIEKSEVELIRKKLDLTKSKQEDDLHYVNSIVDDFFKKHLILQRIIRDLHRSHTDA